MDHALPYQSQQYYAVCLDNKMRAAEFTAEARRNPEQNPKTSPNEILQNYLDKNKDRLGRIGTRAYDVTNLFVSFTEIPKLGVNPQSRYNTPIGIYSYPATYVLDTVTPTGSMTRLPFAGDEPWMTLFKARGNIVVVDKMTEVHVADYCMRLSRVMGPFEKVNKNYDPDDEDSVDTSDYVYYYGGIAEKHARIDTPGGHFWYITMKCAEVISAIKGIRKQVAWNWLFRQIDIDGCVDTGDGIIHENEPIQAVFFSSEAITVLDRISTKHTPDYMTGQRERGQLAKGMFEKDIKGLRDVLVKNDLDELVQWLDYGSNFMYIGYVPKNLRLQVLSQRPFYIGRIKKPSREEYLTVLSRDPSLISHSKEKTKELLAKRVLTIQDITAAIRQFNDTNNSAKNLLHSTTVKQILDVLHSADRDFLIEIIRLNPRVWREIYSEFEYSKLPPDLLDIISNIAQKIGFTDVVYDVEAVKRKNNQYSQT